MASEKSEQGSPTLATKQTGKRIPWRTDPIILNRLPEVERRHLAGEYNTTIAAALGVDEKVIRQDLGRLRQLWAEHTTGEVEHLKARAVRQLMDIHRRAIEAAEWDQAMEQAVLFDEVPDGVVPAPASGSKPKVKRDRKGSAQFRGQKAQALQTAERAVMDAARILGLIDDKPSGPQLNLKLDLTKLSTEQLEKLASGADPLQVLIGK